MVLCSLLRVSWHHNQIGSLPLPDLKRFAAELKDQGFEEAGAMARSSLRSGAQWRLAQEGQFQKMLALGSTPYLFGNQSNGSTFFEFDRFCGEVGTS
jgi:hypothetical protein